MAGFSFNVDVWGDKKKPKAVGRESGRNGSMRSAAAASAYRPVDWRRDRVKAVRYDALTLYDLRNHWLWADSMSIDASLDHDTRRGLRERARYEIANNSYAMGVALAIANAVVGTGPRLQAFVDDRDLEKDVEWTFDDWAEEIHLAEKLRAMRFARFQDGEAFAILYTNLDLKNPVKLDIMPIDAERVVGEIGKEKENNVDGIQLNKYGVPVSYRVLTRHPGDSYGLDLRNEDARVYNASDVIHWYRRTLPEQHRGAPEIAASLNLFALLRRYTLAVVTAAETAADFAGFIQTDAANDFGGSPVWSANPFEALNIERGMVTTLPEGWKISQLKAEQPSVTYSDFKREILGEIGRSLQIPVNIVAGDSSRYNYASGRLDHQEFQKSIRVDQSNCSDNVMRPLFRQWWREYALLNGLPSAVPNTFWYYDGFEHVDPIKEAKAQSLRLANMTTSLMAEYGKQGKDWENELIQIAKERRRIEELGLTLNDAQSGLMNDEEDVEDEEDGN